MAHRISGYTTSYLKPVEIKFLSESCTDYGLAEKLVFIKLNEVRLADNREFFQMNISEIIKCIEEVVLAINDNSIEKNALLDLESQRRQAKVVEYRKSDKYKEYRQHYYARNIDNIRAYHKEKREAYKQDEAFKAREREADKPYKEKHKERYREQARLRYELNKEKQQAYMRDNAEKIKQQRTER